MELRQLGYFVAIAEEGNFTRAAQRMHVAQPGISQQIRSLERELGEALIDRSGHRAELTEAGRVFLPYARGALREATEGRDALADLRGLVRGQLLVGAIQGIPDVNLVGVLAEFHRRHPGVDVTLREDGSPALLEALRLGRLDAAVVGLATPEAPGGLSVEVIGIESLVLVTSAEHPLAGRKRVAIDTLRDESLVTLTRGAGLRLHVEAACADAGFRPRIAFETSDVGMLTHLVDQGLGVTIVPESIARAGASRSTMSVTELNPPLLRRCVALAWRTAEPRSPAARVFIDLARRSLGGGLG